MNLISLIVPSERAMPIVLCSHTSEVLHHLASGGFLLMHVKSFLPLSAIPKIWDGCLHIVGLLNCHANASLGPLSHLSQMTGKLEPLCILLHTTQIGSHKNKHIYT